METTNEAKAKNGETTGWLKGLSDVLRRSNGRTRDGEGANQMQGMMRSTRMWMDRAPLTMRRLLRLTGLRRDVVTWLDRDNRLHPFDVREHGDAIRFITDVPGLMREDIDIAITGQRMIVTARREMEARGRDEHVHALEREPVHFTRSFLLPDFVDVERITSNLSAGVLTIVVPTKAGTRSHKVAIESTSGDGGRTSRVASD